VTVIKLKEKKLVLEEDSSLRSGTPALDES